MERQFVRTEDGSLTLASKEAGELYHNSFGAFTEGKESYARPSCAGEILAKSGRISILDACFGLGYNSWVTLKQLLDGGVRNSHIRILAVDSDPEIFQASLTVIGDSRLEDVSILLGRDKSALARIKPGECVTITRILPGGGKVELEFVCCDLRMHVSKLNRQLDLVFHDPFSPRKVPELWTVDLFRQYYRLLARRLGKVLTFSQAGAVLGGFRQAGFNLWRTTGVGKKAGGSLAAVSTADLRSNCVFTLTDEQLERLAGRSGVPYRESAFNDSRQLILDKRACEQEIFQSKAG